MNENISAPIEEGTVLGKVKYCVDNVEYTTNLIASHSVEKSKFLNYILYTLYLMVCIFLIYKIFFHKKKTY